MPVRGRPAGRSSREYLTPPRGRRCEPHESSQMKDLIFNHEETPPQRRQKQQLNTILSSAGPGIKASEATNEASTSMAPHARSEPTELLKRTTITANRRHLASTQTEELPPERIHAADRMVVPAARNRLSSNARGGRSSGLVPVGRDLPIGLDITSFLGPANPFGQSPIVRSFAPSALNCSTLASAPPRLKLAQRRMLGSHGNSCA